MNKNPIGIFDSGVGGLTVVKKIVEFLPYEKIVYFGDTARVPYGIKSPKIVKKFALEDTRFLLRFNPKLVIIACHTVSSLAADFLKRNFSDIVFMDVVSPGIYKALKMTENKRIGVIGTPATIKSEKYQNLFKKIDRKVKVFTKQCPLFVPLAEEGWANHKVSFQIAKIYLEDLKNKKVDTVILGCTHYPLLEKIIQKVMGKDINLIDASEEVARKAKAFLVKNDMLSGFKKQEVRLFFSDVNAHLESMISNFLKGKKIKIKEVSL